MKVVVFSDSHGNVSNMVEAVRKEQPNYIFHLGDVIRDGEKLGGFCPNIPIERVCGNCDSFCNVDVPVERLLDLSGKRILLLHGHTVHVKSGLEDGERRAHILKADIFLYGHTHVPYCSYDGTLWTMNPGSSRDGRYGIIEIEGDRCTCRCEKLEE